MKNQSNMTFSEWLETSGRPFCWGFMAFFWAGTAVVWMAGGWA